jgi:hypothetical protein
MRSGTGKDNTLHLVYKGKDSIPKQAALNHKILSVPSMWIMHKIHLYVCLGRTSAKVNTWLLKFYICNKILNVLRWTHPKICFSMVASTDSPHIHALGHSFSTSMESSTIFGIHKPGADRHFKQYQRTSLVWRITSLPLFLVQLSPWHR